MRKRSRLLTGFLLAAALTAFGGIHVGAQGSGPTIVALEAPGLTFINPRANNNAGKIAGSAFFSGGPEAAFLWAPSAPNALTGTFKNLGTLKGQRYSRGIGISANGDVTGLGGGGSHAERALVWPGGGAAQQGGPTNSNATSFGRGVNNTLQVAGYSAGWTFPVGALLSQIVNGKRQSFLIGEGEAMGINNGGLVLVRGGPTLDYLFQVTGSNGSGTRTDLTGFTDVAALNQAGQVAGSLPFQILPGDGVPRTTERAGLYLPAAAYGLPAGYSNLGLPPDPPARASGCAPCRRR